MELDVSLWMESGFWRDMRYAALFLGPKHPVTAALTLQTDWIQPEQSALCVMQNPQTDQVGRGPPIVLVQLPHQHLTGHLGRRNHETPSSQRSLHHCTFLRPTGCSQLRDASRRGKDQTDFIFLWIKADFQRTRSMKTRRLAPKVPRMPRPISLWLPEVCYSTRSWLVGFSVHPFLVYQDT